MRQNQNQKILRMVEMAMLLALVIVLQIFGGMFKIGPFSLTLVLIPVVIGSIVLGPVSGAVLGTAFGVVVLIQCVSGIDVGGNLLWSINPFFTALICLGKGAAAGFVPGIIYRSLTKKTQNAGLRLTAAILAGVSAPIVNTGLFLAGLSTFFHSTLIAWAGGTNVLVYIITGLVGINFLIEFVINLVVSPAIATIVNVLNKKF